MSPKREWSIHDRCNRRLIWWDVEVYVALIYKFPRVSQGGVINKDTKTCYMGVWQGFLWGIIFNVSCKIYTR